MLLNTQGDGAGTSLSPLCFHPLCIFFLTKYLISSLHSQLQAQCFTHSLTGHTALRGYSLGNQNGNTFFFFLMIYPYQRSNGESLRASSWNIHHLSSESPILFIFKFPIFLSSLFIGIQCYICFLNSIYPKEHLSSVL